MTRKDLTRALLKSIETGDPAPVAVVDEHRYIQHNPQTHEGSEGLAALFKGLSTTSPKVNVVRAFEDGDFVFAHTEYDFASRKIGFEIFRFDRDRAVEHWDNIQARLGSNVDGRTMVDGPTEAVGLALTERNRTFVRVFVEQVLIEGRLDRLADFVDEGAFVEHNPRLGDGVSLLRDALEARDESGRCIDYQRLHRVLAEGSFVLSVSEGRYRGVHSAFYELFRLANGRVTEHWDTTEKIAPRSARKNDNGKFWDTITAGNSASFHTSRHICASRVCAGDNSADMRPRRSIDEQDDGLGQLAGGRHAGRDNRLGRNVRFRDWSRFRKHELRA